MAELAKQKGVNVINGIAENLPIENQSYDFATMVTTVCFVNDTPKAFSEVYRILKPGGSFIIGLIAETVNLVKSMNNKKTPTSFTKMPTFIPLVK